MDRGAWRAAVNRVTESDMTEATLPTQHNAYIGDSIPFSTRDEQAKVLFLS